MSSPEVVLPLEDTASLANVECGGCVKYQLSGDPAHQHVIVHLTVVPQLNVLLSHAQSYPLYIVSSPSYLPIWYLSSSSPVLPSQIVLLLTL
ncbi:hypothetical protein E2C01_004145 [Portunus trituberculatus]|uniref:Uncharacterized protein n=1 Tax=Portunus trituberculatus TaxID=210409 RepID=A0A5B7CQT4_PORTR|nr:hypothetical protein [Portunus trituberculatus]